ncbi:MAG: iron ABC transporter permease [Candidatus Muirbacterium halophilum]|nr:iron ABC transporter permease [Candidatus Muirbacterium halophilum]MCK9476274.1 iron ABC transporter permease [Candidatus Muirbacterium halophilum]
MYSVNLNKKFFLLLLFLGFSIYFGLFAGDKLDFSNENDIAVFFNFRLSRVLLGFFAGTILALGGLSFQTIFQNELASPYTLGIASGASLGAAFFIKFQPAFRIPYFSWEFVGAFSGALLSLIFIKSVFAIKRSDSRFTILLAGIAFNFICTSMIMVLQYIGDITHSFKLARWTMGSLDLLDMEPVLKMFPFFIIVIYVVFSYSRELDIMLYGNELAHTKGVDVAKIENRFFILISIAVGAVVSICGPIGFIGLMVPHILRLVFGYKHNILGIASIIGGGAFLVFCDALSRSLFSTNQIPVGIVTSLLGATFFLYMLLKK